MTLESLYAEYVAYCELLRIPPASMEHWCKTLDAIHPQQM